MYLDVLILPPKDLLLFVGLDRNIPKNLVVLRTHAFEPADKVFVFFLRFTYVLNYLILVLVFFY